MVDRVKLSKERQGVASSLVFCCDLQCAATFQSQTQTSFKERRVEAEAASELAQEAAVEFTVEVKVKVAATAFNKLKQGKLESEDLEKFLVSKMQAASPEQPVEQAAKEFRARPGPSVRLD